MYATPAALVEYIALAPAVSNNALAPAVYVTPAPVFDYIAPAPVVERIEPAPAVSHVAHVPTKYGTPAPVIEYIVPAPVVERVEPAPAVSYATLAPAEYVTPAPVIEHITPAPVVERIEPAPAVSAALAQADYVTPAPSVKYCQDQRGPESAPTFVYCRATAFPRPQKVCRHGKSGRGYNSLVFQRACHQRSPSCRLQEPVLCQTVRATSTLAQRRVSRRIPIASSRCRQRQRRACDSRPKVSLKCSFLSGLKRTLNSDASCAESQPRLLAAPAAGLVCRAHPLVLKNGLARPTPPGLRFHS